MNTESNKSQDPMHYVQAIEDMLQLLQEQGMTEEQDVFVEAIKGSLASLIHVLHTQAYSTKRVQTSSTGRVLIVDDDALQRVWATRVLEKAGYSTISAETGPVALALLASNPVDAILMDCEIPQLDGFEVTDKIRSSDSSSKVPIIAYSAYKIPGYKERCIKVGMNHFLPKPASADDLLKVIDLAIKK